MTNNGTPNNRLDQLEAMLTSHAEMLNRLAPLMAQVAQVATTTSETVAQHNEILTRIEQQQDRNTEALAQLSQEVRELTSDVTRVLNRSAILDDVLLELRDSHEQHQRNFEEHQRTTNAALNQLGAILIQLTRIDPQN